MSRNLVIASSVVLFHVVALWALQTGLLRRAMEIIMPVEMLSEFIEPPAPKVPPPPTPQIPVKQPVAKAPAPPKAPAPQPMAILDPTPAPNAPTGVTTPQPPAPEAAVVAAVAVAAAAPPAPPPKIELPSSDADYLQNPKPPYPTLSRRLHEEGTVLVSVVVGADGKAQKAEIKKSSGFDRLDQAAYKAVMGWRYSPGKKNGIPTAMPYDIPVLWTLD